MPRVVALFASVILLVGIAACGEVPVVPASSILRVDAARGPNAPIAFGGTSWRARLTTPAGRSLGEFEIGDELAPVDVAPGDYLLETWTVALSDVIMCQADPAQPAGQPDPPPGGMNCTRDEGPPQARCRLALSIPPGVAFLVRYTVLDGIQCRLEAA